MPDTDLHCKIDEGQFSLAMFLSRLLTGLTLLYVTAGCLLFYREFLYNLTALRVPFSVAAGFVLVVCELFCALFLILGWYTRVAAAVGFLCSCACAWAFFAGDLNKMFAAFCVLLATPLLTVALLGPGRISLDFKHAQRRYTKRMRG